MTSRMMQKVGSKQRPLSFDTDGSGTLLLASNATPWAGLQFELHRTTPGELCDAGPPENEHALVIFLAGSVEMAIQKRNLEINLRAGPGTTSFMSGDLRSSSRVTGSADVLAVNLQPEWLHRVELERIPSDFGQLPALACDATMLGLANAMRREIEGGATKGRIYGESLSLAMLSYVLDCVPGPRQHARGPLSEAQCRRLARHIRERLGEDLTLRELAELVSLGPRQFTSRFREAFGITPYQYVLNEKLDEAARRLTVGSFEIAEIAHTLGFTSQSHFAAAFRKRFRMTPRQYATDTKARRRSIF